jgi:hypothetical protein
MRRRRCCKRTENSQGEYIKNREPDYYHKQTDAHHGSSVFTVEGYRSREESDPVYQEIIEIVEDTSDVVQDAPDISDELGVVKQSDEKENQRNIFVTKSNVTNKKPSIVYGVITAKEVAKYRPSTPNIIRR